MCSLELRIDLICIQMWALLRAILKINDLTLLTVFIMLLDLGDGSYQRRGLQIQTRCVV